jgi:cytochrome b involved in lipid metabolism
VVINGKVYDLSEYVDEHPGGVAAMMVGTQTV